MRIKWSGPFFLLFFAFACATAGRPPADKDQGLPVPVERTGHIHECRELHLEVEVPADWRAEWLPAPTAALRIAPLDAGRQASMLISIDPLALQASDVIGKIEEELKNKGMKDGWTALIGNVGAHRAVGMQNVTPEIRMTLFAVDHDRGIYLIIMTASADDDQRRLDEIFSRICIKE